jgi:hypothetical protein
LKALPGKDEEAARQALADFAKAAPLKLPDPRTEQVAELARRAEEWPLDKRRDKAYDGLHTAVGAGNDGAVLLAAEQFLEAAPRRGADSRTAEVLRLYSASFVRWFARDSKAADAAARIEKYKQLVTVGSN